MKTLALTLAATVALSAHTTSAALITPISQSRTVSASAMEDDHGGHFHSDRASDAAPDFGPFSSSVFASLPAGGANASQTSNILDAQITGVGAVRASGASYNCCSGDGSASSSLSVTFQIHQTVIYGIDGYLRIGSPRADGFVRLTGPYGTDVFMLVIDKSEDGLKSFAINGTLKPGEYVLDADISAAGAFNRGSQARFDFDFNLIIPEPTNGLLFALGLPLLFIVCRSGRCRLSIR